jgi:hypothetical protein
MDGLDAYFRLHHQKADEASVSGEAMAIVGLYGSGKVLLADSIEKKCESEDRIVIRVSFKEYPSPRSSDVYHVFQKAIAKSASFESSMLIDSDFSFHFYLQEFVESQKNKHVVFLIEEAQHLIHLPDSMLDALESLRYRNQPHVSFILFGQPQLRHNKNAGLTRLIAGSLHVMSVLPYRAMDGIMKLEEARLGIPVSKWQKHIYTLSGGHYGTIKYIGQLIKKHRFNAPRLTEKIVMNWAEKEDNFPYFLRVVWHSLDDDERLLVRELLETGHIDGTRQKIQAFEELTHLGVIHTDRSSLSFIVPMYRDALLHIIRKDGMPMTDTSSSSIALSGESIRIFGTSADSMLTHQERRVLAELIKQKGEAVTYENIGTIMWGSHSDRFSLWSIAKLIERVRKKISAVGIARTTIKNVSGKGYLYRD